MSAQRERGSPWSGTIRPLATAGKPEISLFRLRPRAQKVPPFNTSPSVGLGRFGGQNGAILCRKGVIRGSKRGGFGVGKGSVFSRAINAMNFTTIVASNTYGFVGRAQRLQTKFFYAQMHESPDRKPPRSAPAPAIQQPHVTHHLHSPSIHSGTLQRHTTDQPWPHDASS